MAVAVVFACAALLASPVVESAVGAVEAGETEEIVCEGDQCQPLPPEPEDPTPGTLVPNSGNPPLHVSEPKKPPKHRSKHRKGHRGGKHRHGRGGHSRQPTR